ncbi:MAG: hypothetical protein H7833_20955, partial [Magnetococcus sp. DMHC-1]
EQVSVRVFDAWIKPLRPAAPVADAKLELLVDSQLIMDVVQKRYGAILESCLASEAGDHVQISYRLDAKDSEPAKSDADGAEKTAPVAEIAPPSQPTPGKSPTFVHTLERTVLDARFTFENFVVGGCNQFVHAASPPGPVIVWNLTRRCNLNCLHC